MTTQHFIDRYVIDSGISTALNADSSELTLINQLIAHHLEHLPFCSANVLLKKELSLDPDNVFQRLVEQRRGGYCYEHNKLFQILLAELGCNVCPLLARVLLNGNEQNGRTHRITLVEIDGIQYLVDVGFGVQTPRMAIPLEPHSFSHLTQQFRLHQQGPQHFRLEIWQTDRWQALYRFDLSEVTEMDCDIGHFYASQSPNSGFYHNLVVSKITHAQRHLIKNLDIHHYDDELEEQYVESITSASHLHQLLSETFQLGFSEDEVQQLFDHQVNYLASKA